MTDTGPNFHQENLRDYIAYFIQPLPVRSKPLVTTLLAPWLRNHVTCVALALALFIILMIIITVNMFNLLLINISTSRGFETNQ